MGVNAVVTSKHLCDSSDTNKAANATIYVRLFNFSWFRDVLFIQQKCIFLSHC